MAKWSSRGFHAGAWQLTLWVLSRMTALPQWLWISFKTKIHSALSWQAEHMEVSGLPLTEGEVHFCWFSIKGEGAAKKAGLLMTGKEK